MYGSTYREMCKLTVGSGGTVAESVVVVVVIDSVVEVLIEVYTKPATGVLKLSKDMFKLSDKKRSRRAVKIASWLKKGS